MVQREVPITDSVNAMPDPARLILLRPLKKMFLPFPSVTISLNQAMKQVITSLIKTPPLQPKPL